MKQISDNDNDSVDGWNREEQNNWIKYTKYFIALSIIANAYLLIISQIYRSYFPDWLHTIIFALALIGLIISVFNIFWKAEQQSIIRQICFLLSGFVIIINISGLLFLIASFQADYDQKVSQDPQYSQYFKEWQQFTYLFYSILGSISITIPSFMHIQYSLYLCQDQQFLMTTLHFYNAVFLLTGIALNHYAQIKNLQLFILLFLIVVSCSIYGANLKKIKVAYFSVGIVLLCYLILNQYQHFLNIRSAKEYRLTVLQDCPNTLRTMHQDFLKQNTECEKYLPTNECSNDQKAFKWEQDLQTQISKRNTQIGCLNMNCCGIVADRSKVKLNVMTAIHQLVGFATLTIIMYMSQKPPLLHTDISTRDLVFGCVQILFVIAIIFLFSKELSEDVAKFEEQNSINRLALPQGCSQVKQLINMECQFSQCTNLKVTLQSNFPFNFHRLSNSKYFYQEIDNNSISFYGEFESIEDYINNYIYICASSSAINLNVKIEKSLQLFEGKHRNLAQNLMMFERLERINFWRLELQLNVMNNYTITLFEEISNRQYLKVQDQNIIQFIQEQSYLIIVESYGYIQYENHIIMNKDTLIQVNLAQKSNLIQIILSGSEKSMIGASFATSLYKQYTTTLWMGSNQFMNLQCLDKGTQIINIKQIDYPILLFIINPDQNAFLRIFDQNIEIYRSYAGEKGRTQLVLCLQGNSIRVLNQYINNTLPSSLTCQ